MCMDLTMKPTRPVYVTCRDADGRSKTFTVYGCADVAEVAAKLSSMLKEGTGRQDAATFEDSRDSSVSDR